jgi:hypothetical protein
MKTWKQILTEKTVRKFELSVKNKPKNILDKLALELGPGKYHFEADGVKTSEADFTFKATFKVLDDKGAWLLTKGARKFFRVDAFTISPTGSGRPNTRSVKDMDEIRVTL